MLEIKPVISRSTWVNALCSEGFNYRLSCCYIKGLQFIHSFNSLIQSIHEMQFPVFVLICCLLLGATIAQWVPNPRYDDQKEDKYHYGPVYFFKDPFIGRDQKDDY